MYINSNISSEYARQVKKKRKGDFKPSSTYFFENSSTGFSHKKLSGGQWKVRLDYFEQAIKSTHAKFKHYLT